MGVHRCMPLDEIEALDEVNCLDAHIVEKRDRFVVVDVKKSRDGAANVGTNFNDTLHSGNLSKAFDGGLEGFMLGINKIKFSFDFGKFLSLTMCFDLCNVVLANKTQDSNQACFESQGLKRGALDVGGNKQSRKVLRNEICQLVGCQRAKTLSKVRGDLVKACGQDIARVNASYQ